MRLADIHCHVLPYVDDGAEHVEESEKLLADEISQGVRVVCATPHLRKGMFESGDEAIIDRFHKAQDYISSQNLPLSLYLGREYYCDDMFLERLSAGKLIPLGLGKTILMEFSGRSMPDYLSRFVREVQKYGLQPLVAHVERYWNVDAQAVCALREQGALIQINAGSLLGREGRVQKKHSWDLLKRGYADVVASDAHDPTYRPVELELCANKIEHKLGQAVVQRVLWDDPIKILSLDKGE